MGCMLCPRNCNADRKHGQIGYCKMDNRIFAARASLHMWEEPVISGNNGSGAVFFSGCPLGCVYCQNHNIAIGKSGKEISIERLVEIFFELKEKGANNINLVTPTHYIPQIREALTQAKKKNFNLPIIYNTGSYEKVEALKLLEGLVDVYLPDLKYMSVQLSKRYSNASDYFFIAAAAIKEMFRQVGTPIFYREGDYLQNVKDQEEESALIKKGVIIRHLVLPQAIEDSKNIVKYIYDTYGNNVFISILNQYTPVNQSVKYPELLRKVTQREYEEVVNYAVEIGVERGFIQEGDTAKESFIPQFNNEGI